MSKLIQATIHICIDDAKFLLEELDAEQKDEIFKNLFYRSADLAGYEAVPIKTKDN